MAASLVLLVGCKKDGPQEAEPATDGLIGGPVTQEVTCPECGAVYSVTCKNPDLSIISGRSSEYWIPQTAPTAMWEVLYKSNDNAVVPFDEWSDMTKIQFNCQVQDCKGVMECNRESFKKQNPTIPTIR